MARKLTGVKNIWFSTAQIQFLDKQENASAYIRNLIDADLERRKHDPALKVEALEAQLDEARAEMAKQAAPMKLEALLDEPWMKELLDEMATNPLKWAGAKGGGMDRVIPLFQDYGLTITIGDVEKLLRLRGDIA